MRKQSIAFPRRIAVSNMVCTTSDALGDGSSDPVIQNIGFQNAGPYISYVPVDDSKCNVGRFVPDGT
jgi:hypothetical protein